MNRKVIGMAITLLGVLVHSSMLLAVEPSSLARQMLGFCGRERGVALVTDASGIAPDLLAASGMIIVDQQPDEAHRAVAAQAAAEAGTLGRRLYVAIGAPTACVLADGYADLVVQAAATDRTLTPESAKELARVVAPYGGTLVVGNPDAEKAGLTEAALKAWAEKLGGKAEIKTEGGLWAVWKRPALPGGDDWTHWYYDATANPVSKDTALTYPFELAWICTPLTTARTQTRVAAGGRLFTLTRPHQFQNGYGFQTHFFEGGDELIARSLANGEILWRYFLDEDDYPDRSSLIAMPDAVYVMRREQILVFDPQSGKERAPISVVQAPGEVKSIWLQNGVLLALTGPTRDEPAWCSVANTGASGKKLTNALMGGKFGFGDTLVAWDIAAGKERWRWSEPLIDSRMVGIGPDGLVVAYAKAKEVLGLNLSDGKPRWRQADPDIVAAIETFGVLFGEKGDYFANTTGAPGVIQTADMVLIGHSQQMKRVAVSPVDGHLLWTQDRPKTSIDHQLVGFFTPALSYLNNRGSSDSPFIDPKTGTPLPLPKLFKQVHQGCSAVAATPRYFLSHGFGAIYDIEKSQPLIGLPLKGECGRSAFASAGTLVTTGGACSACDMVYGGVTAMRSFTRLDLRQPPPAESRLMRGTGKADPGLTADARDWATMRHDTRRSGGGPVKAAATGTVLWRWTPPVPYPVVGGNIYNVYPMATEYRLVEPVSAGSLVVVAGYDGAVTGLDHHTGKEHWRTSVGGRVMASPTIADGRVFVGSADGTVSALSAADGSLIWRFRVAPYERRVMCYGHLQSQWPVTCCPLVADGMVYASAGNELAVGGYVVALDVATGAMRWERNFAAWSGDECPIGETRRPDMGCRQLAIQGAIALDGDRLHVKTHGSTSGIGLVLDRRTGQQAVKQPVFDRDGGGGVYGAAAGAELSVMPEGLVLNGGLKVERNQNVGGACRSANSNLVAVLNAGDRDGFRQASLQPLYFPCWNEKWLVVYNKWGFQDDIFGLELHERVAWNSQALTKLTEWGKRTEAKISQKPQWGPISPDTGAPVNYNAHDTGNHAMATALAEDAVLVTSLKREPMTDWVPFKIANGSCKGMKMPLSRITGGQVSAFDIADGKLRWSVELPAPPADAALSLDRDGNAIVGLQDGSVVCVGDQ